MFWYVTLHCIALLMRSGVMLCWIVLGCAVLPCAMVCYRVWRRPGDSAEPQCSIFWKGTNGVSNNGVTANFIFFDRDFLGTPPVNLL